MSAQPLDVAILGAGHNGLVAAAYLARAGLSVERARAPRRVGGACVTEELWPGVRASPARTRCRCCAPRSCATSSWRRTGCSVDVHEPYLFAPLPDGRGVVTWSDRSAPTPSSSDDWSRADADAYRAGRGRGRRPPRAPPADAGAAGPRALVEAIGPELLEGAIADELAGIPSEAGARAVRAAGADRHARRPADPGTSFVSFYHDLGEAAGAPGAWGYARGGMGAVTAALRAAAEAAGAQVRLDSPVERVLIDDGARDRRGARGRRRAARRGSWSRTRIRCARRRSPAWTPRGWRQAGRWSR